MAAPVAKAALALAAITAAALALVLTLHAFTADTIRAHRAAHATAQLRAILAAADYAGALPAALPADRALPAAQLLALYPAYQRGKLIAVVAHAAATDGYNGSIELLLATRRGQRRPLLRVLQHRETAGIADFLAADADRAFDGVSGATITATALLRAEEQLRGWLQNCINWQARHSNSAAAATSDLLQPGC